MELLVKTDSFDNNEVISKTISKKVKYIIILQMANGKLKITKENEEITWMPIIFNKISPELNSMFILAQQIWFIFKRYLFNQKYEITKLEGYPFAMIACLAKILKLTEISTIVYISGDWLNDSGKRKSSIVSYFGNKFFFPFAEKVIANNCDLIINLHQNIVQQREKLIGKKIKAKQIIEEPKIPNKIPIFKYHSNKILYLGKVRSDSGLIEFLDFLISKGLLYTFNLHIIGPKTTGLIEIQKKYNFFFEDNKIKYLGFIERENYKTFLSDYFCGLNLITSTDNYSTYTIQAKLIDYISYGIPILTSININDTSANLIRDNKLGLITSIDIETINSCVTELYINQYNYHSNIREYFNKINTNNY